VRSSTGGIIQECRVGTRDLEKYFATLNPSQLVMETCSEAFKVASWARAAGHQVAVVPSTLAPALGVGERGVKNDKRDARNLSLAACRMELTGVHVPSDDARKLRALCTSRECLVEARTKLINSVRGWLRTEILKQQVKRGTPETFPRRVREVALKTPPGVPEHTERLLVSIEALNEQIHAADKELKGLVAHDEVCRRLMTAPGIGPVTACRFRAAVDDVARFPNAHALESYLGLTAKEHSSGETERRGGITKAGPSPARRTLIQAAWVAWRTSSDPMVGWAKSVAQRRGKHIAVTALARKMVGILFAMWRDGADYNPTRGAAAVEHLNI
jgi:transposase